jgi:hypothetical protein
MTLPPLPKKVQIDKHESGYVIWGYTADQMRAYAAQAVQELTEQAEPVAWQAIGGSIWSHKTSWKDRPLYAAPQPARQPLTDEQIDAGMNYMVQPFLNLRSAFFEGVRYAERSHGVGGKG